MQENINHTLSETRNVDLQRRGQFRCNLQSPQDNGFTSPRRLWIITQDDKFVSSFIIEQFRCLNKLEREHIVREINKGFTCKAAEEDKDKTTHWGSPRPRVLYWKTEQLAMLDNNDNRG